MKKSIWILALAALIFGARAAEVKPEQACAAVEAWRTGNGGAFGDLGAAVSATPSYDTDGTLLWYVVSTANGGTVVTAGDDRVEPILAVLPGEDFGGVIPAAHPLHAFMRTDVRGRLAALGGTVPAGGAGLLSVAAAAPVLSSSAREAQARWNRLAPRGAQLQAVGEPEAGAPALIFGYLPGFWDGTLTHWGQSGSATWADGKALYNYYTPNHSVCGCVATAGATILQYFNVTNGPVAVTNTCTVNEAKTDLVTIGGHYDWSILPKALGGKAADPNRVLSDEQRELLGRVTYDVGVLSGMDYGMNGTESGANEGVMGRALRTCFGFKTVTDVFFSADDKVDKPLYDRLIYNQLRCGAPVGLSIFDEQMSSGHSVVAVGYGEDFLGEPYTRVFMGWSGSGDAWYSLPKITGYPKLVEIITDLSLDGNCTPVCGRVVTAAQAAASEDQRADRTTGAAFVPVVISYTPYDSDETTVVTNYTGANGCFGVRVPYLSSGTVTCGDETIAFGPEEEQEDGGEEEIAEEEEEGEEEDEPTLEDYYELLPPTMSFTLEPEKVVADRPTPSAALDAARRKGKMLLLVSGREGDAATEETKALLAERVDALNENFVVYYADYDTDGYGYRNGVPALGVYNPAVFDLAGGWAANNGCIGGINIALETDEAYAYVAQTETGVAPSADQIDELINSAAEVWMRFNEPRTLKIDGISTAESTGMHSTQAGGYVVSNLVTETDITQSEFPMVYSKMANGDQIQVTVPETYTNDVEGVVSKCRGWVLVSGLDVSPKGVWLGQGTVIIGIDGGSSEMPTHFEELDAGDGTEAVIRFGDFADAEVTLVWLWDDIAYRVTAEAMREGGMSGDGYGEVDINEAWVMPGEEITVTATGTMVAGGRGTMVQTFCKDWGVKFQNGTWGAKEDGDVVDGCTMTFKAWKPRAVRAYFDVDPTINSNTEPLDISVATLPAELQDEVGFPTAKYGTTDLAYGANEGVFRKGQKAAVTLTATTFTDATGGVWRCVGWTNGSGSVPLEGDDAHVAFTITENSGLAFVWETVDPGEDDPLELELQWNDSLNNLRSGDDAPAGMNMLVAKSNLPKNFKLSDYGKDSVKNTLRGWTVTGIKLDTTGNLVAVLATNDAVLVPKGVDLAAPLSIASNNDGSVTVSAKIANAAKGFWYSLFAAEELTGPWSVVADGYESGAPTVQATVDASEENALELEIVVQPIDAKRFYRLRVTEKKPE